MPTRDEEMATRRALEAHETGPGPASDLTEHDLLTELGQLFERTERNLQRSAVLLAEAQENNDRLRAVIEAYKAIGN